MAYRRACLCFFSQVRELCEASSREAARRGCLTAPDRHGGQPLHAAAYKGHAEAVRRTSPPPLCSRNTLLSAVHALCSTCPLR